METQRQFQLKEQQLEETLAEMGRGVLAAFDHAIRALERLDSALADQVIAGDDSIDRCEVNAEEFAIELVLLHQVVAGDLRLAILGIKAAPELERIGDLACSIAARVKELAAEPQRGTHQGIAPMAAHARAMLVSALNGLHDRDAALAQRVLSQEDSVDANLESVFRALLTQMLEDPRTIRTALRLQLIAKAIEQIADGAVALAELTVYLVEGKDIRHRHS